MFQGRLNPNEAEVSAYAWLEPQILESIAATQDGAGEARKGSGDLPQTVRYAGGRGIQKMMQYNC